VPAEDVFGHGAMRSLGFVRLLGQHGHDDQAREEQHDDQGRAGLVATRAAGRSHPREHLACPGSPQPGARRSLPFPDTTLAGNSRLCVHGAWISFRGGTMRLRARSVVVLTLATIVLSPASTLSAGDLLVSSRFNSRVLRYNAATGTFVGVYASGWGVANPNGIAFGPDGNLYVGNGDEGRVLKFDGQSGDFLGSFVTPSTPGGLAGCRAILFGPDGNLYVDSGATN